MTATVDLLQARKADVEAVHRMMATTIPPPRQKRRTEHLGTEKVVNRNLFWRKAKGTILHAVAYQTIVRQDARDAPTTFTCNVNGTTKRNSQRNRGSMKTPSTTAPVWRWRRLTAYPWNSPSTRFYSNVRIYAAENKDAICHAHSPEDAATDIFA